MASGVLEMWVKSCNFVDDGNIEPNVSCGSLGHTLKYIRTKTKLNIKSMKKILLLMAAALTAPSMLSGNMLTGWPIGAQKRMTAYTMP